MSEERKIDIKQNKQKQRRILNRVTETEREIYIIKQNGQKQREILSKMDRDTQRYIRQ